MKEAREKIAKILRADKDVIVKIDRHLSKVTGKSGVIEKIVDENDEHVKSRLEALGISLSPSPKEVYDGLISKIKSDDQHLYRALGRPNCARADDCKRVLGAVQKLAGANHGFFIKRDKAEEFLLREPPKNTIAYLDYSSIERMLEKEDLFEIYSALRFIEGSEWLNNVFFKQYETLTPDDFEEREIVMRALDEKWAKAAEKFVGQKWHNISHLKEMGVVFVIPVLLGIPGELLRMVSLILHYIYEVPFYSELFRRSAEVPELFDEQLVSLLRGDVVERRLPESEKTLWFVVQRYLAKDDENDWRLFVPHISPEAHHWQRAEETMVTIGEELDGFSEDLRFWENLDWVGDYFKDEIGNNVLVSFNLVDSVMSLVKQRELIKYLYHHQEALWNKIFTEYFGRGQLEHFFNEYLLQGYFEV